ncbi:hypothetical protein EE612_024944 [Oryza sativa]|uniref:Uncharacterized protein n=4 Tax=Oryza TaxID=4527 RepID=A3AWG3_ORYSJ|nr:hypothetical protein OsI_16997 [Oryza sativa Indica Group]EAZ31652.1 hypothetical protein OsJ_15797 [Oryza sativa Japonica Group]KAB8096483.1 hypothetical protein EE612_024944 [Oryza sativa]KAF2935372.1 hypothetical protein DAI22_04g227100 [Oryza sativa Japonica Group]
MCIAAWAWQSQPAHRLLLLFNRDEYHSRCAPCSVPSIPTPYNSHLLTRARRDFLSRPTQPAGWWAAGKAEVKLILGGRDELGGGTWLGCTRDGKLAFLTNVREPGTLVGAKSRGELPVRFLQGNQCPLEYAEEIAKEADQYNGFNLVLADVQSGNMAYISNRPEGDPVVQKVLPGFHVLSNAAIDCPWPKMLRLGQSFNRFLATQDGAEVSLQQMVEELMMDPVKADKSAVPDTGVDPDWEYQLSSIFIDTEKGQARYGTRSMTALAVKFNGEVTFYERYLESNLWKENLMQFELEMSQWEDLRGTSNISPKSC